MCKSQKLKIKTSDIKNNAQSDDEPNAPTTSNLKMSDFDLDDNLQNRGTSTNKIENTESKHNKKINKSYSDQEDYIENVKRNDLKRKLRIIEQDLDDHKKKKCKTLWKKMIATNYEK